MGSQGKMIEMAFHLQTLQLESGIKNGKDVIVLGYQSAQWSFPQSGILFERFVEDFYRPSFLGRTSLHS